MLGFRKDKFTGTYKPVWLYNSSKFSLENITTCEVFDFTTNAWRSCCVETIIISLDLHTEAFQVIPIAPFANAQHDLFTMCDLDNRLCVSSINWPNQDIWSFNS
ncbi:hypothetical protein CARUB_v10012586mg [Capsella rubella]|uniref:F-box associated domain-containing protein n=1 Tax=Capsella rubella TaxID=81985 RepID=R0IIM8_9BRAS|nr:hypothetical protein CARUB_v10012586mg [Capsella rubella]